MSEKQPDALRLADWLQAAVQTYPQMSEYEPGGYCTEVDQMMDEAAAELRRLHAECEELRKALERISGFTMSQFASINDMALECVNVANDALAARAAKEQA